MSWDRPGCQWATTWNPYHDCDAPPRAIGSHDDDPTGILLCNRHRCAYVRFNKERGGKVRAL